jgi:hypothetical protein
METAPRDFCAVDMELGGCESKRGAFPGAIPSELIHMSALAETWLILRV